MRNFFSGTFPHSHLYSQHLCAIVLPNFRFVYLPFHFSFWSCCCCCRCCFFQNSHFIRKSRSEKKNRDIERKSKSVNARELKTVTGNEKSNNKKCENLLFIWIVVCLISTHTKKNNKNYASHFFCSTPQKKHGKGKQNKNKWQYQISNITIKSKIHRKNMATHSSIGESENCVETELKISTLYIPKAKKTFFHNCKHAGSFGLCIHWKQYNLHILRKSKPTLWTFTIATARNRLKSMPIIAFSVQYIFQTFLAHQIHTASVKLSDKIKITVKCNNLRWFSESNLV